jgi:small subunit ribosomal protein S17
MSESIQIAATFRERTGIVLKNRMQKTVVVEVVRRFRHPMYSKFLKRRIRYKAHDETNACNVGDTVVLQETRPLSKTKRWRVKEIVTRAVGV